MFIGPIQTPCKNYAFIDGSFNPKDFTFGWGGFLVDQRGVKHHLKGSDDNPELVKMRNVAGEIFAAVKIVELAISLKMKYLRIYYDYDGVANWVTGKWKAKNDITRFYAGYMRDMMEKIYIDFEHVTAHTGILGNEEADRLAKEAVGIFK